MCLALLNAAHGAGESRPVQALGYRGPIKLVCVGDSITEGFGAGGTTYAGLLGTFLGKKWEVTNLGVSGATMLKKGDKPYSSLPQYAQGLQIKPDVVTIALGTNDTKPQNWKIKAEFEADYKSMIEEFRKANKKVIIYCCLPPPAVPEKWGINGDTIKNEVIPLVNKIAKDTKCYTINLHASLEGKSGCIPDGVHPNAAGQKFLAEAMYKALTGKAMPATPPKEPAARGK